MSLRTVMQAGPAKVNELFARLLDTSDGAVKTMEKLLTELKTELELHTSLELTPAKGSRHSRSTGDRTTKGCLG